MSGQSGAEVIPIEFTTDNGWIYDGQIELPPATLRNGYAVMMLGGGMGSPIDPQVVGDIVNWLRQRTKTKE